MLKDPDRVGHDKLVKGWFEGFLAATNGNIAPLASQIDRFNSFFSEDAIAGDDYDFLYLPGKGTEVTIKGEYRGEIDSLSFKQALFSIWLGKRPVDDDLKEGMLGKE